ncbi:hypothetical protein GCM10027058_00930 [Microbacterium neimengense]
MHTPEATRAPLLECGVRTHRDEAFGWEKRRQGWSHAKRRAFAEGGLDAVVGWSARSRRKAADS